MRVYDINLIIPECLNIGNVKAEEFYRGNGWSDQYFRDEMGKVYVINGHDIENYSNYSGQNINVNKVAYGGSNELYVLDNTNKIWNIRNYGEIWDCINQTQNNLLPNGTTFKDIIPGNSCVYAIDQSNNLWLLKKGTIKNINSLLYGKTVKSIVDNIILTEDGKLLEYDIYQNIMINLDQEYSVLSGINMKEIINYRFFVDNNDRILMFDEYENTIVDINTLNLCEGKKIKYIYGNYILDEDQTLWKIEHNYNNDLKLKKITTELQGKTLTKISADYVFMSIDSDGNLYKYGIFEWLE